MGAQIERYEGREQSFIKHEFLTQYLQAAAYKTLQGRSATFNFVDAFAGPWQVSDENFSDASFNQALRTLDAVKSDLETRGVFGLKIRFCFCERRPEAVARLREYALKNSEFIIHVFEGPFEDNLEQIAFVCNDGFTFTFIDPTGWNIRSEPVLDYLKKMNGEFLINFMSEHVNRHAEYDQVSASFGRFLADPDWKKDFDALPSQWSNEERVLHLLRKKIKGFGAATYLPHMPILKPRQERIKMRLLLGTHSSKGVEVFRDVHSKVELAEFQTRSAIAESNTGQMGLFTRADESAMLQAAHGIGSDGVKRRARATVLNQLAQGTLSFQRLATAVMEECPMRLTHTKDLLNSMKLSGEVSFELVGKEKKPQPRTMISATYTKACGI
ncbi:three-Cys-motif partner protein TcmP [Erythrobacter sp. WG]|uniref:three-Cys-motif partner protein TcmP n=1 Tax=Erythrobacter sp. WG TaxID=2985510 RepID=UPI002270DDFC|nr:three-Cys-motif partner protein TcmP [Erythrobacter sp. WG]